MGSVLAQRLPRLYMESPELWFGTLCGGYWFLAILSEVSRTYRKWVQLQEEKECRNR